MSNVSELTDYNYKELVENSLEPIFVDFYSPYCGPCQNLLQILEELKIHGNNQNVNVLKCDVSQNPKIANKFQIQSVPFTCIITIDKKITNPNFGLMDPSYYFNIIDKANPNKSSIFTKLLNIFKA